MEQVCNFDYTGPEEVRLDKFLVSCLPDYSRSRLQGLVKDGFVQVNGRTATKSGQNLETGDAVMIRIPPSAPSGLVAENIPLEIVFENEQLMVINKPAGMVVHPAAGHATGTLVQAALAHAPELEGIGGEQRPGVVHRLDKDTSGLILIAKDERTHRWLQDQFRLRKVHKTYLALVDGHPPTPVGRVEASIGRDTNQRKQMAVVSPEKGREAISEYRTQESFPDHALLAVHPLTGRTHQIRLHMAFLKCPIVADTLYGHRHVSLTLKRQFLHAFRLEIILPGEKMARVFEAPLPQDLENALEELRQKYR
jgi:23S rRNA pseudouridine1911/1915/1917 synthase